MLEKLEAINIRFQELEKEMNNPDIMSDMKRFVKLNKDYKDLLPVIAAYKEYKDIIKKRAQAENDILKAKEDEENLNHWIKELETLSPKIGEMEELQTRRQEMMSAEKIIENLNYAYASLTQGKEVSSSIRSAQSGIAKANNYVNFTL